MTSTAAEPGPYDALEKAKPDEPIFTLCARDAIAPSCVEFWADQTRKATLGKMADIGPTDAEPIALKDKLRQCTEADVIAWEMRRWRKGLPAEAPDAQPEPGLDNADATGELTEAQRKAIVAKAVQHLRESAFQASEARDLLKALGLLEPGQECSIDAALLSINAVAEAFVPKRAAYQAQAELSIS